MDADEEWEELKKEDTPEDILLKAASDSSYDFRYLQNDDFERGFPAVLQDLTEVGEITREQFLHMFAQIRYQALSNIIVVVDKNSDRIVGSGTLLVEQKFIHSCGKAGHIEDIVIAKAF